ncbi:MAG: hypothetical protein AAFY48_14460, partial [Bacteroidota bacterium]
MKLRKSPLLLFAFAFLPLVISTDCGPGYAPFYGYSFINPEITEFDTDLAPFFLNFTKIHEEFFTAQKEVYELDNVKEWRARYCNKATEDDIRYMIYKTSRFQLQDLLRTLDAPDGTS